MADINKTHQTANHTEAKLDDDETLRHGIEMLFFAYRDFTSDPDEILARDGLGRAHHRVIYFVGRHPGITVAELLSILRITKQSLSRVLKEVLERGLVEQKTGQRDRRQRLLYLTEAGVRLEQQLTATQRARVARAYRSAGKEAVEGYMKVLAALRNPE